MATLPRNKILNRRDDSRTILHFDYDCFYASVFEAENPALKTLPLAVQQKQIVVTCNYEARRRGLRKLQLIKDAKKTCPDLVVVLGEDLTKFRDASKALYGFLRTFSWNGQVERLGFDEVFLDVSDMVDYNLGLLNPRDLNHSFFCLSKTDPTIGFPFDATVIAGNSYAVVPQDPTESSGTRALRLRLHLASHLAQHLREQLEQQKGYTSTVGVSTSKLLAKLVGNVHKPRNQTTLMPPYASLGDANNVTRFLDEHEIGNIPGIGFKSAQKIRDFVLGKPSAAFQNAPHLPKETLTVKHARTHPGLSPELLERILSGPGAPHGIGPKIWGLIHGLDDLKVGQAREIPKQISIEDSYIKMDAVNKVLDQLAVLAKSLIDRMRTDLLDIDDGKRWMAFPKTLRLSTRPRSKNADGSRLRTFNRISRSAVLPNFIFSVSQSSEALAEKLVTETLLPLFRRLHPEKSGWDLSLINIAVTNMADAGGDSKASTGRDISKMFERQKSAPNAADADMPTDLMLEALSDHENPADSDEPHLSLDNLQSQPGLESAVEQPKSSSDEEGWHSDNYSEADELLYRCDLCGGRIPEFASIAHQRFHAIDNQ